MYPKPVTIVYLSPEDYKGLDPQPLKVIGEPPTSPDQTILHLEEIPGFAEGTALMYIDGQIQWVAI